MKLRNPKNRTDLSIKKTDKVLEVGGGHNPHPRANVVVDKFPDTNYHRSGNIKVLSHQKFLQADGENLPFEDYEFDYVICCQVLEHVENPERFLKEQFRVAKKGFLEVPSLLGEYLFPRESHKWIMHEINNTLYLVEKNKIDFKVGYDLTELTQMYLPRHSIGFKILEKTHPNLITIRLEWKNEINFIINPTDPEILKFFSGKWLQEWSGDFFPPKSAWQEFKDTASAMWQITKTSFQSKVLKKNVY